MNTIFALASAPGRAGVAVFRVSGPASGEAIKRIAGISAPRPRRVVYARFRDPVTDETVDAGLCLWFPGPASYTGEDVAEFHVHGGRAVVDAMAGILGSLKDIRLAEPGEFTRRAFEHGRFGLTEAEAVADLVAAETEAQRRQALRQFDGALGRLYDGWRDLLVRLMAHQEAWIDFPDEDLPAETVAAENREIDAMSAELSAHLDDDRRGERLRDGLHIAILGPPNVGKSSLLNALARRDAAIVSETAGTTRDVIEVHLDLGGYPVVVADTAGLRDSGDAVEQEGVRRALSRAETADIRIVMFDTISKRPWDSAALELVDGSSVVVLNKIDLLPPEAEPALRGRPVVPVSAVTGEGVPGLVEILAKLAREKFDGWQGPALTRARHRTALTECLDGLNRARAAGQIELRAEDLRRAARSLGRITGRVEVEDILDVVFRDFCIGK